MSGKREGALNGSSQQLVLSNDSLGSYRKVAGGGMATSQSLADTVDQVLWLTASDGAHSLFLELDRHDELNCEKSKPRCA